jgi:hypothetical protein
MDCGGHEARLEYYLPFSTQIKSTAKPGVHFLIRREAYKLITEALEAQGIHYAHRKVIVEVSQGDAAPAADSSQQPESGSGNHNEGQSMDQAIQAAAAAAAENALKKNPDKQTKG